MNDLSLNGTDVGDNLALVGIRPTFVPHTDHAFSPIASTLTWLQPSPSLSYHGRGG